MDISLLSPATLLFLCILMFIGASPSSVGGGTRTTTFAVVILSIFQFARGKDRIKVFDREIDNEDAFKSFIIVNTAIFICIISILILVAIEPFFILAITFEVFSDFGTTGLSLGITPYLSVLGKLVIIFLCLSEGLESFHFC